MKFNERIEQILESKYENWEETFKARGKEYIIDVYWGGSYKPTYVVSWKEKGKPYQVGSGHPHGTDFKKAVKFAKEVLKKRIITGDMHHHIT